MGATAAAGQPDPPRPALADGARRGRVRPGHVRRRRRCRRDGVGVVALRRHTWWVPEHVLVDATLGVAIPTRMTLSPSTAVWSSRRMSAHVGPRVGAVTVSDVAGHGGEDGDVRGWSGRPNRLVANVFNLSWSLGSGCCPESSALGFVAVTPPVGASAPGRATESARWARRDPRSRSRGRLRGRGRQRDRSRCGD